MIYLFVFRVYVHGGVLQSPPALIIDPGMNGICIFAKYSFSLCGVEGLLSYKFKGKRLCLMFSNPFLSAFHNRKFNLMIDDESKLIDERLFHEMGLETGNSSFRIVSESSITSTSVKGGGVEVTATMSSAVKSVIKIEIRDV